MSNMWRWDNARRAAEPFPKRRGRSNLEMDDFPYPKRDHGEWFWESGFNMHPIDGLEDMRDWNLRAVFGAFNAMKNRGGKAEHANAKLEWVAYIGGTRESRQLLGDVVLTREDIVEQERLPGRHRADDVGHRPALSERAVREEVPRQSVHLEGRLRQRRGPQARLPGAVSLLLLEEHREPLHGRPQCSA